MSRIGQVGKIINLRANFQKNGVLFDPYSIISVTILTARTGGTTLATLAATKVSTGLYETNWTVPAGTETGYLYDAWKWVATSDLASNTRTYKFKVTSPANATLIGQDEPLFIGQQEIDFFSSVNKELIQRIVRQKITYFSVSEEHTQVNSLYNESVEKVVYTPVELNCLVLYNPPVQTSTNFSMDTIYSIECYIHKKELEERNVICREGDFVRYGDIFFEINQVTYPQITFGQIANRVMAKLNCTVSRQSNFQIEKE